MSLFVYVLISLVVSCFIYVVMSSYVYVCASSVLYVLRLLFRYFVSGVVLSLFMYVFVHGIFCIPFVSSLVASSCMFPVLYLFSWCGF